MSRSVLRISIVFLLTAVAFIRGPVAFVHADISADTDQRGSSESGDAVGGQVVGVSSSGNSSVHATNRSEDVDVSTGDASGSNTQQEATVSGSGGGGDPLVLVINAINDIGGGISEDATREEVIEFLRDVFGIPDDAPDEVILEALEESGFPIEVVAALLRGDEFIGGDGGEDLDASTGQSADVSTGDAIAGQAVGVVTTLGATADLVLSNESLDTSAESGDANFNNASSTTVVASPK